MRIVFAARIGAQPVAVTAGVRIPHVVVPVAGVTIWDRCYDWADCILFEPVLELLRGA
ncbi:MAG: hypothetical protein OEQ39_26380 [Gammaproteobacteria bacterium]|nr:hypothetical protein [Gammaproteobacteria bacterium]MDH3468710.1 hypothetical protein [Gammaproteobacteria bacterium]